MNILTTTLGKKRVVIVSAVMTIVMFIIVMGIINPMIDGSNGMGVLALQLAFDKALGIEIIQSWGERGAESFRFLILADYLYAICYSIFFASLLSRLIIQHSKVNQSLLFIPFIAGLFDWIENTMEILFMSNPMEFSETLFFIHSIVASLKWVTLPVVLAFILKFNIKSKI